MKQAPCRQQTRSLVPRDQVWGDWREAGAGPSKENADSLSVEKRRDQNGADTEGPPCSAVNASHGGMVAVES